MVPSPGEEDGDWAISLALLLILEEEEGQREHPGSPILCPAQYQWGLKWTELAMMVQGDPRAAAKSSHPRWATNVPPSLPPLPLYHPLLEQPALWSRK